MSSSQLPEFWLSGPVPSIPTLLQPVAHALLQAKAEIHELFKDFDETLLWERPAGLASPGFHLQHIVGVQDRLFSYVKGDMLSEQQLQYLKAEGVENRTFNVAGLLENLDAQTERSIQQLSETDTNTLTETRGVGRKQIPSTVLGLLFHTAEHTMRHTGQLLVTVKILEAGL
ncbi:MAG TPA: DinB family protein [Parafilimonas sp.]|nr:DinB family protein [Parafilimonas sp.]